MTNRQKYLELWGVLAGKKMASEDSNLSTEARAKLVKECASLAEELRRIEPDREDSADEQHAPLTSADWSVLQEAHAREIENDPRRRPLANSRGFGALQIPATYRSK